MERPRITPITTSSSYQEYMTTTPVIINVRGSTVALEMVKEPPVAKPQEDRILRRDSTVKRRALKRENKK
jgi:predicted HAD superfamily phosphohydrolase